jgi:ABC-type uncharacterized transport system substrate-binding protein
VINQKMIAGVFHIIMANSRQTAQMRGILIKIFVLVSCLVAPVSLIRAHPHMWVDLNSQIVMGDDGMVTAINQEWLFDDFFSTALIEDATNHPQGYPDRIVCRGGNNLGRVAGL